jgi:hypothetical protein
MKRNDGDKGTALGKTVVGYSVHSNYLLLLHLYLLGQGGQGLWRYREMVEIRLTRGTPSPLEMGVHPVQRGVDD